MKRSLPILAIAAMFTLGACSKSEPATPAAETSAAVEAGAGQAAGAPNAVDARFGAGGLGHHAQAVELAEIALDPKAKARKEILDLGNAITAPSPEFDSIEALLTKWGKPLELSKEEMAKMDGMASQDTVTALSSASGPEFDKLFLETLAKHHDGAIQMATKAVSEGSDAELRPIAQKLLDMRTNELVSIKALLASL